MKFKTFTTTELNNLVLRVSSHLLLLFFILLSICPLKAQVLISNTGGNPDSSAILEIKSTSKGLLPPRMSEIERDAIPNPVAGLIIYCMDCSEMQLYNGSTWTNMIGSPATLAPLPCGNMLSYGGQNYATVSIGSQCWMAQNLNIGTKISATALNQTDNDVIEKYCYDDDDAKCITYGGLYQWNEMMQYTTMESTQGICPTGWHLPSDDEFKTLELALGMTQMEVDMTSARGTDQGSELAGNANLWTDGNLDLNGTGNPPFGTSGFDLLPGGFDDVGGLFENLFGAVWLSTELTNNAYYRSLFYTSSQVNRDISPKTLGYSVRCVQD